MTRPMFLISMLLLSGCGEPEQPRFVPATGDAPAVSTADHPGGDKEPRETTVPKNIPMH